MNPSAWTRPVMSWGLATQTSRISRGEATSHSARVRHSMAWTGTSDPPTMGSSA